MCISSAEPSSLYSMEASEVSSSPTTPNDGHSTGCARSGSDSDDDDDFNHLNEQSSMHTSTPIARRRESKRRLSVTNIRRSVSLSFAGGDVTAKGAVPATATRLAAAQAANTAIATAGADIDVAIVGDITDDIIGSIVSNMSSANSSSFASPEHTARSISASSSMGAINKTSNTSSGFQITLDVLERHVKRRRVLNQSMTSIETNDESMGEIAAGQHDSFCLDLQLKAIERLKQFEQGDSSVGKLLTNFLTFTDRSDKQKTAEKITENLRRDGTSPNRYHIAREKSGNMFLRVIRSPSSDKGKMISMFLKTTSAINIFLQTIISQKTSLQQ